MSAEQIIARYEAGERDFQFVVADHTDLSHANLRAASFYGASLRGTSLRNAALTHVQFKSADLTGADLSRSSINATDLIGATFVHTRLAGADLTGAALQQCDCTRADLSGVNFGNASLSGSTFLGANLSAANFHSTYFDDTDVRAFCDAKDLRHSGPSYIDARTVMRSYTHPRLKRFMLDCGVPEVFAEYMIDCAKALDTPLLRRLMQSTFISYGGPDEAFARRLYIALRAHSVVVFFFPETATVGERINNEVYRRLQEHDRVLLVCSKNSLDREGVVNEIQETLDREARDGGATYLLPITLDDYVFGEWRKNHPELAERVCRRIIADFRGARRNKEKFDKAMARLVDALKLKRPGG